MSNGQLPAAQIADLGAVMAAAITDALDALTASDVAFAPVGDLSSTDVQAAVVEVYDAIATKITDALGALTAADVAFVPAGGISATDVQAALVEVKAAIATQVAALVDSAPGTLDTLNELAAALGDDPNFATTITTALSEKLATDDFLPLLTATLVPGDNVTITPVGDTLVIDSTGGGGGPASTRWEVVVVGSPPEAVTNVDDTDWTYVEVPI